MINLKLALRSLVKSPFVTLAAVISLALGIGANAAIFSLSEQVLLRPLPVSEPGRLVNLAAPGPKPGSQSCNQAGDCESVFSYPMFRDLEREQKPFVGMAAHCAFGANLAHRGQTLSGRGMFVSGSYFGVLGLQPAAGRLISAADDRAPGEAPVVVLSHEFWRTRFSQSPDIVNGTLIVNGNPMTIIGVAPRGFDGTTFGAKPQVFVPITMRSLTEPGFKGYEERRNYWMYVFARLRPGVTLDQARTAINLPYRAIITDVEAPLQKGMSDKTMAQFKARVVSLEEGARGQSQIHVEARVPLMLLFGVTVLVLVIACANIANLLLARAATRTSEMAVRLSIGAARWQLVAQLLAEACVLAVCGGLAGLIVAHWTGNLIAAILPPEAVAVVDLGLNGTMLVFTACLALATGLLFGLVPALHATRPDLVSAIKGQAGQPAGARAAATFRTILATSQIMLSMALLIAAGWFTKSLVNVSRVDLGLKADGVVTFRVSPALNGYSTERSRMLFERLEDALAAVPGVSSVSGSMVPVLAGSNWGQGVSVQGFEAGPDTDIVSYFNAIGPDYLKTLGIRLLSGREFGRTDGVQAGKVAIVNEQFAKKFGLGRDAVGKRMARRGGQPELDIAIVGVAQDSKYSEVKSVAPPVFYVPYRQEERIGSLTFYVRTPLAPDTLLTAIPRLVAAEDPNLPIDDLRTLPQQIRENVFMDRLVTVLATAFAALATLLAAVGLYGVLAYTVAQRTREIGLRMALGAVPGRVRGMVLGQVLRMTAVGGLLGLVAAVWLGRSAQALLYQLTTHDPAVLASAVVALLVVALGAGLIPAFRASRVDPLSALRYE